MLPARAPRRALPSRLPTCRQCCHARSPAPSPPGLNCGKYACNAEGCTSCKLGYGFSPKGTADVAVYQPIPRGAPVMLNQCLKCDVKYGPGCSLCNKKGCMGCL